MEEKEKATTTAANRDREGSHHKDSKNIRIKSTIKTLFLSGKKLTAKEINDITGSNDARKAISTLRNDGWRITDILQSDRCKLYWLMPDDRQLNLFGREAQDE